MTMAVTQYILQICSHDIRTYLTVMSISSCDLGVVTLVSKLLDYISEAKLLVLRR